MYTLPHHFHTQAAVSCVRPATPPPYHGPGQLFWSLLEDVTLMLPLLELAKDLAGKRGLGRGRQVDVGGLEVAVGG